MNNSTTGTPQKIVWLASYPKSGNTFFRAFLTALLNNGEVNINELKLDSIFSSRAVFYNNTDIDSTYLYDEEIKIMLPDVYRQVAVQAKELLFIKVHDAFEYNKNSETIIPEDVTHCAVYFVRNPLDVAGSLASHNQRNIQDEVDFLTEPMACFATQKNNLNKSTQIRQFLSDWSGHVNSWTTRPSFPVLVIRYEDMVTNPFNTFKQICSHIGLEKYSNNEILKAIEACNFNRLKDQETKKGFKEKPTVKTPSFFRKGSVGNWKSELNPEQIQKIIFSHKQTMTNYNYL